MTYGVCSLAGYDPVEGFVASSHLVEVEVHLSQRLCEDDVKATAPVDDVLGRNAPSTMGLKTIG
jgi:hypothetical protein